MALLVVIIIGALVTVYGLSSALLNLDDLLASNVWLDTAKSQGFSESCVDNVISRLYNDNTVSGNVNVSRNTVVCDAIISGSGNIRTIVANATSTDAFSQTIISRVQVKVNIDTLPFTVEDYKDILD
jgi:hypothetical protein